MNAKIKDLGKKLVSILTVALFAFVFSILGYLALTTFIEGDKSGAFTLLFCIFFLLIIISGAVEVNMGGKS
jgi:hypothetical protein